MTRALGVIRLSELVDETTSPARQRESITAKAEQRGSEIIGWAVDLDVSASKVHPMKRPELRQWFDRAGEYDEVIFWRLDRFVRRTFPDFADMVSWADAENVGLVSATEDLDLSGPMGRLMATALATVAEMESKNTSDRVKGAHDYMRRVGRWGGGNPPYGYKAVPNTEGAGYILAVDDERAEIAREMARRVIVGESAYSIALDLNERGIRPPTSGAQAWHGNSVRRILRSKAMLGVVMHNRSAVPGDDGMPLTRAKPLISPAEWDALQRALEASAHTPVRTRTESMLLNIAVCKRCGGPLYRMPKQAGNKKSYILYYRCFNSYNRAEQRRTCDARLIRCDELDAWVDLWMTTTEGGAFGHREIMESVLIPGDNHNAEIAAINQAMTDLTAQLTRETISDDEYDTKMSRLRAERARLRSLPAEPDKTIERPAGITIAEHWGTLDAPGKRRYLLDAGIVVKAQRDAEGRLDSEMTGEHPNKVVGVLTRARPRT